MKFIIAVSIFFLMPFITFIFSLLDVKIDNACYQCVENPTDNKCMEIVNQSSIDECGFQSHSSSCCSKKYNSNGFVYKYNIKSKSCDR